MNDSGADAGYGPDGPIPGAQPQEPPPMPSLVGTVLAGRYRIVRALGEGAMGAVYLGEHLKIGRKDAIKVLRGALATDRESIRRFERGARNLSAIRHPNVCTLYDFGETEDGSPFLAMEFVTGETLKDLLEREGALPPERAIRIARQVADALEAAHDVGIVHRDLKPANIMLERGRGDADIVKVVDFDIAKGPEPEAGDEVTRLGFVVGTPEYMSPEQLTGERLDGRSDIYSLGIVLFRMLTGMLPFPGTTAQRVMIERLTQAPMTLQQVRPDIKVPPALQAVIDRALERDRARRYERAEDFARALAEATGEYAVPGGAAPGVAGGPRPGGPAGLPGAPAGAGYMGGSATSVLSSAPDPVPATQVAAQPGTAGGAARRSGAAAGGAARAGAGRAAAGGGGGRGIPVSWLAAAAVVILAGGGVGLYFAMKGGSTGGSTGDPADPTGPESTVVQTDPGGTRQGGDSGDPSGTNPTDPSRAGGGGDPVGGRDSGGQQGGGTQPDPGRGGADPGGGGSQTDPGRGGGTPALTVHPDTLLNRLMDRLFDATIPRQVAPAVRDSALILYGRTELPADFRGRAAYLLAEAYKALGDADNCISWIARAITLDPGASHYVDFRVTCGGDGS